METFTALLAFCEGNPPVTGGFRFTEQTAEQTSADDLRGYHAHYDVTVMH